MVISSCTWRLLALAKRRPLQGAPSLRRLCRALVGKAPAFLAWRPHRRPARAPHKAHQAPCRDRPARTQLAPCTRARLAETSQGASPRPCRAVCVRRPRSLRGVMTGALQGHNMRHHMRLAEGLPQAPTCACKGALSQAPARVRCLRRLRGPLSQAPARARCLRRLQGRADTGACKGR